MRRRYLSGLAPSDALRRGLRPGRDKPWRIGEDFPDETAPGGFGTNSWGIVTPPGLASQPARAAALAGEAGGDREGTEGGRAAKRRDINLWRLAGADRQAVGASKARGGPRRVFSLPAPAPRHVAPAGQDARPARPATAGRAPGRRDSFAAPRVPPKAGRPRGREIGQDARPARPATPAERWATRFIRGALGAPEGRTPWGGRAIIRTPGGGDNHEGAGNKPVYSRSRMALPSLSMSTLVSWEWTSLPDLSKTSTDGVATTSRASPAGWLSPGP